MKYSIEPRDRIYVEGYGFSCFAKIISKNLSNKFVQKLLDSAKKSTTDAIKTASTRAIQKIAGATGDLIGNETAEKITSVSKKSPTELHSVELHSKELQNDDMETPIKILISKRKITNHWWIRISIIIEY